METCPRIEQALSGIVMMNLEWSNKQILIQQLESTDWVIFGMNYISTCVTLGMIDLLSMVIPMRIQMHLDYDCMVITLISPCNGMIRGK